MDRIHKDSEIWVHFAARRSFWVHARNGGTSEVANEHAWTKVLQGEKLKKGPNGFHTGMVWPPKKNDIQPTHREL